MASSASIFSLGTGGDELAEIKVESESRREALVDFNEYEGFVADRAWAEIDLRGRPSAIFPFEPEVPRMGTPTGARLNWEIAK